jgi:hypothetical protein
MSRSFKSKWDVSGPLAQSFSFLTAGRACTAKAATDSLGSAYSLTHSYQKKAVNENEFKEPETNG